MAKKKMTPDEMRARYAELSVLFDECGHSDDTGRLGYAEYVRVHHTIMFHIAIFGNLCDYLKENACNIKQCELAFELLQIC